MKMYYIKAHLKKNDSNEKKVVTTNGVPRSILEAYGLFVKECLPIFFTEGWSLFDLEIAESKIPINGIIVSMCESISDIENENNLEFENIAKDIT